MMKRNILAVVIPALLAASAANAAEIYNKGSDKLELNGKVDGLHYFSDDDSNNGDQSYVRFGFKGETQINNSLTGYGQWEYNIQANNSEGADAQTDNKTRLAFAGLRFDKLGSIDYGRNYGVLHNVTSWTDVLPEFGGDASIADNFMGGRATGVLTYSNSNFFDLVPGMDFAVQYQGKNDRADTARANGDGWGLSTSYKTNIGLAFAAAYSSSDRTDAQTRGNVYSDGSYVGYGVGEGKRAESWVTAVKYDENNVYLAAMYGESHNATPIKAVYEDGDSESAFANKAQNLEVVAQYKFDFNLTPSLAYVQSKGKDIEGIGKADLYKYVEVGATYQFNPNMSTYVDYKINLMDKDNSLGLKTDDIVALGLVYQF